MKIILGVFFGCFAFGSMLNAQSACFSSPNDNVFTGPTNGQSIDKGDFDNDGKLDVVIANFTVGSNKMNFIRGDGDGTFQPPVLFEGGSRPVAVKAHDFNLDGNLDVAVVNFNPAGLAIILGNGNGTFQAPVTYTPGSGPNELDLGDINLDGAIDIVVSTNSGFNVFLGSNAAPGTYTSGSQYNMSNGTRGIVLADFDGDGNLDAATSNMTAANVSFRPGTGTGTFGAVTNFPTAAGCFAIIADDYDNDGDIDIATSNETSDNMSILINIGAGNFATAVNYTAGDGPEGIINQDINMDGITDIVLVNSLQNSLSVYLGNGDGTFQAHQQSAAVGTPKDLVAGSFNTDGFPDIAVSTAIGQVMPVFIGNGTALYSSGIVVPEGNAPKSLHYADFNQDGIQDLIVANSSDNNFAFSPGLGNGNFSSSITFTTGTLPVSIRSADLNHDGYMDVVTANSTSNDVSVFLGDGTGNFSAATNFTCNNSPNFVRIADIDNDTHQDIVVVNAASQFSVLKGAGNGSFAAPVGYNTGGGTTPVALTINNLNADGFNDVAVVCSGSNNIKVFLNSGTGIFGTSTSIAVATSPSGIDAGDLDNDGDMDLVVSNSGGNNISRLLNNGSGTFGTAVNYSSGDAAAKGVVLGDYNSDGKLDAMVIFNVATGTTGCAAVFMGNGAGTLTFYKRFSTGVGPLNIISADFNNDSRKDIGVVNEVSKNVSILLNTTAVISAAGPTTFCNGNSVILQGITSSAYNWSSGETTQSITATNSGTYSLTTSEGTSNWCTSTSQGITVTVTSGPSAPTITASGPTTLCNGGSVVLTSSQNSGNIWSTGDTTQSITVPASGSYTVSYISGSCTSLLSAPVDIIINEVPVISPSGPTTICSGDVVTLTSSATSGTWSSGETTQSITVAASGTYTMTSTPAGCPPLTSNPITVTVNNSPGTPLITSSGSTIFCDGQNVVLTSSASTGNTWSTGETTQSVTVSSSGSYAVSVAVPGCAQVTSLPAVITVNPIPASPIVTAVGPTTFCSGSSVVLISSALTGNVWSTGELTPSITVSNSGTYTASVVQNGCSSGPSSAITVAVNPNPAAPTITAGGSTSFCIGGSVTLTSSSSTGNTWSTGEITQSITVATSGSYTVTTTSGGCISPSSSPVTVTVNSSIPSAPTISTSGPATFCSGGSVTLTSSASTGNTWSDGQTGSSVTLTGPGTYSVTQTVNGCTSAASAPVTVIVLPNPTPPSITPGGPTTFCNGASVVLTSSISPGIVWSTGASSPSITVTAGGNYTVTYTDANGCSSTSSPTSIAVYNLVPDITPAGNVTICDGTSITLTSSSATGNLWSTGQTTQSITVTQAGNYTVTAPFTGCAPGTSAPTSISLNPVPSTPTVTPAGPITMCEGDTAYLFTSTGMMDNWSTGQVGQSIAVTETGDYFVTTTNAYNCSTASTPVSVIVNPLPQVGMNGGDTLCYYSGSLPLQIGTPAGGTYSGNGVSGGIFDPVVAGVGSTQITYTYVDANNCENSAQTSITVDNCEGLDETKLTDLLVFPNPSAGMFTISSKSSPIEHIRIFDNTGKLITELNVEVTTEALLDIRSLADGMYSTEIRSGNLTEQVQLIINK